MTWQRHPGRRGLREEMQETWHVYDASRPVRRSDFELAGECTAPAPAEPPQPSAQPPHGAEAETHGGALGPETIAALEALQARTVKLTNLEEAIRFSEGTDAQMAELFGISEMDVREARKWARENAERLGTVTITGIDTDAGKVTLQ